MKGKVMTITTTKQLRKKNERTGVAEVIKMLKLTLTAKKMFKC